MPYTVAGTLKLPETGQPAAGVILKFIALQSISPVLDRFESVIVTSSTGAYSIKLEYNTYSVFATLYDNKPINCGQIVLNSTVATGLDLPTLLNDGFSEPTTPSWIVELQRLADVTTSASQAASTSASQASTSASQAAASAATATTKASEASTSASTATTKASQAATSATGAASSATTATSKASEAATSASTATTKATDAATSASTATSRATAAANSATEAANSAATATTKASEAAASATSAATSASQASQISGLSTVAEAIGLAALPLPDVWAPLSDSLRMITGYGREVKVGEDVVSRMVNFSRSTTATYIGKDGQLKTAAVNEPRFEKEGLLIEGQSTNLFLYSKSPDSYIWSKNGDTSYIKIADGVRITGAGFYSYKVLPVIAGQAYTFSVTCKVLSGSLNKVGLEGDTIITLGSGLTPEDGTVRLSGTVTPNVNGYATCVYYPTQNSVVEFTDIQFEALPFASSYIPTNGAAVTRAADFLQFIGPGNHPDVLPGVPFTFAMRMSCEEAPAGSMRDMLFCQGVAYSLLRRSADTIRYYRDGGGQGVSAPGKKMNVIAVKVTAENSYTLRVGASQATKTGVPNVGGKVSIINISNVAGHVRDFRIWQHAVTDEQLKAIV